MSNNLLTRVWKLQGIDPSSKLVLARLADMANDDTACCWPSITRLEEETGLARSSVCRILSSLESLGLVAREKGRTSTTYTLQLNDWNPEKEASSTPRQSHHRTSPTIGLVPPSDQGSPIVGLPLVLQSDQTSPTIGPKPKENPNKNHQEPKRGGDLLFEILPFDSAEFAEKWAEWEQHKRQKRKSLTPLAKEKQLRKLASMGEDRAIAALEYSIESDYQGIFEPRAKPNGHFRNHQRQVGQHDEHAPNHEVSVL